MTSPALLRSADLKRMASIVQKQKVCIEIEIEGKTLRISPEMPPPLKVKPLAKPMELEF